MRVEEFVSQFRSKTGDKYNDMGDFEVMTMVAAQKPDLLKKVDREDLARLGRETRKKRITKERQKTFKSLSGISRFGMGVERGIIDTFMGIKQLMSAPEAFPGGYQKRKPDESIERYKEEKKEHQEMTEGDIASGFGELAGSLVATAPVPGATGPKLAAKAPKYLKLLTSLATGATVGGLMGAGEFVDEDETRAKNALYGAMFGAGGQFSGELLKKLGAKTYNAVKERMKTANLQELWDLRKKYNIPMTESMFTGQGKMTEKALEQASFFGTSGFMRKGAGKTQKAIQKKAGEIGADWDESIQKSLKDKSKDVRKIAKKNFDKVEKLSGGARINPEKTIKSIDKTLSEFSGSRTKTQPKAISELEVLKENLQEKKINFSELRATRQTLSSLAASFASDDPTSQKMLIQVIDNIEKDMDVVINAQVKRMGEMKYRASQKLAGEPIMNPYAGRARRAEVEKQIAKGEELKKAYQEARRQYKEEVVPYKDINIINAIKTSTPDELFNKFIKKGSGDKAKNFYDMLDEKGQQALRDGFLDNAITNSIKGGLKDINEVLTGRAEVSPAQLSGYIERMIKPGTQIFKGKELEELKGFAKIMRHVERYGQLNEAPSNGMSLIPLLKGAALTGVGYSGANNLAATGVGVLATGTLTKLMSLLKTRGARFTLASSEIGSQAFEDKLNKAIAQLPKITQQTAKELEE